MNKNRDVVIWMQISKLSISLFRQFKNQILPAFDIGHTTK